MQSDPTDGAAFGVGFEAEYDAGASWFGGPILPQAPFQPEGDLFHAPPSFLIGDLRAIAHRQQAGDINWSSAVLKLQEEFGLAALLLPPSFEPLVGLATEAVVARKLQN